MGEALSPARANRIAVLRAELARLTDKPLPATTPSLHQVLTAVAAEFGVTTTMLLSPNREPPGALARHAGMAMLRRLTLLSLPQIGRHMRRDHTTVLHGVRRVEAMAAERPDFAARLARVEARLTPHDRKEHRLMDDHHITQWQAQIRQLEGQIATRRAALLAEAMPKGRLATVLAMVAKEWGVEPTALISDDRRADIVRPRLVAMALAYRVLGYSQARIARHMNRSASMVGDAVRTIAADCESDSILAARLDRLATAIAALPKTRSDA